EPAGEESLPPDPSARAAGGRDCCDGVACPVLAPIAGAALVAHVLPPNLATTELVQLADLAPDRRSAFDRDIARWVSPRMPARRSVGDLVMVVGAWRRRRPIILAGALLIALGRLREKLLA